MARQPGPDLPIGPEEFEAAYGACISGATGLVVAVSGGPDSTCLMHLLADLRSRPGIPPVTVATVDHGLRPGSAAETAAVAGQAATLGLPCHRLVWEGPKPDRAIQERARQARYGLLAACCKRIGATHLVTAHTRDDQAETVLFRLARGSGIAGLAGMRAATERDGITLTRPLLGFAKARLVATCRERGWPFVLDPSNDDPRFVRARLRRLTPLLAREGLGPDTLVRLASRAARADAALAQVAARLHADCARASPPGTVSLDAAILLRAPAEIVIRVLARTFADLGRAPRLDRAESLAATLADAIVAGTPLRRTLGGYLVRIGPDGILVMRPERPRSRAEAPPVQERADGIHAVSDQIRLRRDGRAPSLGNGG